MLTSRLFQSSLTIMNSFSRLRSSLITQACPLLDTSLVHSLLIKTALFAIYVGVNGRDDVLIKSIWMAGCRFCYHSHTLFTWSWAIWIAPSDTDRWWREKDASSVHTAAMAVGQGQRTKHDRNKWLVLWYGCWWSHGRAWAGFGRSEEGAQRKPASDRYEIEAKVSRCEAGWLWWGSM